MKALANKDMQDLRDNSRWLWLCTKSDWLARNIPAVLKLANVSFTLDC